MVDSVTDESARQRKFSNCEYRRHCVPHRERNKLIGSVVEEKIIGNDQGSCSCVGQAREGGVDFTISAGAQYLNIDPDGMGRSHYFLRRQHGERISRVLK